MRANHFINSARYSFIIIIIMAVYTVANSLESYDTKELTEFELSAILNEEDPSSKLRLLEDIYGESDEHRKFSLLPFLGKAALGTSDYEKARKYADELLLLAKTHSSSWNYGNAIHDANIIYGMIALYKGQTKKACDYLIEASKTPGSPQIRNFGPSLMLAKELIKKKEFQVVILYFGNLKKIWINDNGQLDSWISSLEAGVSPNLEMYLLE